MFAFMAIVELCSGEPLRGMNALCGAINVIV